MARVFAQDVFKVCNKQGISKYEMILLAAHRGKNIKKIPTKDHVLPAEEYNNISVGVTALREIETGNLDLLELKENFIKSYQHVSLPQDDQLEEDQQDHKSI